MRRISILFLVVILTGLLKIQAQTTAHQKSSYAKIDPVHNSYKVYPEPVWRKDGATWIYGPTELESWRLQVLRNRKDSAKLKVGYPGTFHTPASQASYRLKLKETSAPDQLTFRAAGKGEILINDKVLASFESNKTVQTINLAKNEKISTLQFNLTSNQEPPALLINDSYFSTSRKEWEWKTAGEEWQSAFHFAQTTKGLTPAQAEDPLVKIQPASKRGDLYDFGRELFGYVLIRKSEKPELRVGESTEEALDSNDKDPEQSNAVIQVAKGLWRSKSLMAFQYVNVPGVQKNDVYSDALFYPVQYKGAFACSDSILTKVWMTSAYTLHLCMHDFLIDGIKRDRLPWTGDMAMSMMADAYAFGDPEIVRRSLAVLGRAGISKTDINGIIDYSLWWMISQDHYQLYFGDREHLKREWPRIRESLELLGKRCDKEGFLNTSNTWLFIDWVKQEKWTALQILWWWAQQSAIRLAERMDDSQTAARWKTISADLKQNLLNKAWSSNQQRWQDNPEFPDRISRHANMLAVVSGLATKDQYSGIKKILLNQSVSPVGTPYMAGFENMAIARLGNCEQMIDIVRNYWGEMLKQGATSFWEAYNPGENGKERLVFYDRPYGRSLCHAWSAGPAAFLPSEILGLRPLEDGWKRFSVNPATGSLKRVSAAVPSRFGTITVDLQDSKLSLTIPAGTTAEVNGEVFKGPQKISKILPKFFQNEGIR